MVISVASIDVHSDTSTNNSAREEHIDRSSWVNFSLEVARIAHFGFYRLVGLLLRAHISAAVVVVNVPPSSRRSISVPLNILLWFHHRQGQYQLSCLSTVRPLFVPIGRRRHSTIVDGRRTSAAQYSIAAALAFLPIFYL